MITLYVFNPEHDIALANGDPNCVPPANIVDFATRDALLMPIADGVIRDRTDIGDDSFKVVVDKSKVVEPHPAYVDWSELSEFEIDRVEVWGWDTAICQKLRKAGVAEHLFPSSEELSCIKELSHRRTAMQANEYIADRTGESFHIVKEFFSTDDIVGFLHKHTNIVLKSPFSGSGRGLRWGKAPLSHSDIGWMNNILEKQGSVMAELRHEIVVDFASLFYCDNDKVEFVGFSLFETRNGAYQRNIISSDEEIISTLCNYIENSQLEEIVSLVKDFLTLRFSKVYRGSIGVDMAICKVGTSYRLIPIIEINVRRTMGFVYHNSFTIAFLK